MRYTLIVYRPNTSVARCRRGCCGYDEIDSLFEVTNTQDRGDLIETLARSMTVVALHDEHGEREHHLFVDGFEYISHLDYSGEVEEPLQLEGVMIFAEAEALVGERVEAAKREAERKAAQEAEQRAQRVRDQETARLAQLTKERDELATKLGVAS